MKVKMPIVRLSICVCGFSVLKDSIPLGSEYAVIPESVREGYYYRCGGCGREQRNVTVILASQSGIAEFMPLPLALFKSEESQ